MTAPSPAEIVKGLSEAESEAVLWLPSPRDADPVRWQAARPYSSTWRKGKYSQFRAFVALVGKDICDTKVSRGERLFRLSKPIGLAVRAILDPKS